MEQFKFQKLEKIIPKKEIFVFKNNILKCRWIHKKDWTSDIALCVCNSSICPRINGTNDIQLYLSNKSIISILKYII